MDSIRELLQVVIILLYYYCHVIVFLVLCYTLKFSPLILSLVKLSAYKQQTDTLCWYSHTNLLMVSNRDWSETIATSLM